MRVAESLSRVPDLPGAWVGLVELEDGFGGVGWSPGARGAALLRAVAC